MPTFLLLWTVFIAVPVSSSKPKNIDWQMEAVRELKLFDMGYAAHKMREVARETYAKGFVYLSQNSIIEGDFEDLSKHFEFRSIHGHWEPGHPHIVSTCHNTGVAWTRLRFKDEKNQTRAGYQGILYEYFGNKAKVLLVQVSV